MSLAEVRSRIAAACIRAGRPDDDVVLVAVTKYATVAQIEEALHAGVTDLGENHAQQLRDRAALASLAGARWHFIGPLQRNKARWVAPVATAFHALDRVEVAAALSRLREGAPLDCFIQVNAAGEATKAGVVPDAVGPLLDACAGLSGVRVVGLMAMPPLARAPEDSRPWFASLRELAHRHGLSALSMGTTADFEVAVEEGATHVRIGAAVFT